MEVVKFLRYRTANGSCNNLEESNYGTAGTPYQRILLPSYAEGTIRIE